MEEEEEEGPLESQAAHLVAGEDPAFEVLVVGVRVPLIAEASELADTALKNVSQTSICATIKIACPPKSRRGTSRKS